MASDPCYGLKTLIRSIAERHECWNSEGSYLSALINLSAALTEARAAHDEQTQELERVREEIDDRPCCDEDYGGSHYHCVRCGAACSMMGHTDEGCALAREQGRDRPQFITEPEETNVPPDD